MRIRITLVSLAIVALVMRPSTAHGQLWSNGTFDGFSALASERNTVVSDSRVYDNFIVSGSGWIVTSLFGEFVTDFEASDAYWEIRSEVSEGLGGTLLISGTNSVIGSSDLGDAFGLNRRLYTVGGFAPFFRSSGEYWLTIAPVGAGSGRAFLVTTSGGGAINAIGDNTSFWDSPHFGVSFANTFEGVEACTDFAYGLDGLEDEVSTVPEPSAALLLATGLGVLALGATRRRKRK